MIAAIRDPNPVIFIDDRWLHQTEGLVPEEIYEVPIGQGVIRKTGSDLTLVATSFMAHEALKAVQELAQEGIDVELIDLRTVKPIDGDLVFNSVKKTGKLVIADGGWKTCGLAAEVAVLVYEAVFEYLKAPIKRVTLPDCPAPASRALEKAYYPKAEAICHAVRETLQK